MGAVVEISFSRSLITWKNVTLLDYEGHIPIEKRLATGFINSSVRTTNDTQYTYSPY